MDEQVFDASAVLAYANHETGWEAVLRLKPRLISTVNYAETLSKLVERGVPVANAIILLEILNLQVIAFDEAQAVETARLRTLTSAFGLSLGDRACLALATIRGVPAVTAERKWAEAAPHVTIVTIR